MSAWIALSETLPPEYTPVLATDGEYCVVVEWYDPLGRRGETMPDWQVVGLFGHEMEWQFHQNTITHWMPLPALPEKVSTHG